MTKQVVVPHSYGMTSFEVPDSVELAGLPFVSEVLAMTGDIALGQRSAGALGRYHQILDPNGSARNVDLPSSADAASRGLCYFVDNVGAQNLTLRDDGGAVIVTLAATEKALVTLDPDGPSWEATAFTAATGGSVPVGVNLISGATATSFPDITTALAAAVANDVVLVGPGTYNESVTIPDGVRLVGFPLSTAVTIAGADTTSTRVTFGASCALREVTIIGPSSGANPAISANVPSAGSIVFNVRTVGGGGTGDMLYKTGAGQLVVALLDMNGGTIGGAVLHADAGIVRLLGGGINANSGTAGEFLKFLGTVTVEGQLAQIGPLMNLTDALQIGGTADVELTTMIMSDTGIGAVTNGLHLVADGITADLSNCLFRADTFDFLVDPALVGAGTEVILANCELEKAKSNFPALWNPDLILVSYTDRGSSGDNPGSKFVGAVDIGTPQFPSSLSRGEGDSSVIGMVAYTFDDSLGTFTDVTPDVIIPGDGNTASWNLDADDGLYIGYDARAQPRMMDFDNIVALVGAVAFEVLTGTGPDVWSAINYMIANDDGNDQYAETIFARPNGDENLRMNTEGAAWAAMVLGDPPATGTNRYWMRVRNVGAITTSPTVDRIKVGTSYIEDKKSGTNRFGEAELITPVALFAGEDLSSPSGGANAPQNLDVTLSANVTYRIANSLFPDGSDARRAGAQFQLPEGIDTSRKLILRYTAYTDGVDVNDVEIDLFVALAAAGGGASVETTYPLTFTPSGTAGFNGRRTATAEIDISTLVAGDTIGFVFNPQRATDANPNAFAVLNYVFVGTQFN